jgi:hypothetical protein
MSKLPLANNGEVYLLLCKEREPFPRKRASHLREMGAMCEEKWMTTQPKQEVRHHNTKLDGTSG